MADRAACQRRVYRLALLLTGRPTAAMEVVREVVDAQPNLSRIDSAHLDRLTVLRSREHPARLLHLEGANGHVTEAAEALADLTAQQREAWVFARVYRLPLREMSRAMDCSTTATARHLELADEIMAGRCSDAKRAAEVLLKAVMGLDVPAVYHARQRRRRIVRWLIVALILALLIVLIAVVLNHLQ